MPEIGVDGAQYSFPLVITHELLSECCCLLSWEAVLLNECEVCPALAKACGMCSCIGDILDLNNGIVASWLSRSHARPAGADVVDELLAAIVGSFCLPLSLRSREGMASWVLGWGCCWGSLGPG